MQINKHHILNDDDSWWHNKSKVFSIGMDISQKENPSSSGNNFKRRSTSEVFLNSKEKILNKEIFTTRSSHKWIDRKPSILAMENEWKTYSTIEVQRRILEKNTKIIKEFMNSLAVPSWYRGVSIFQKQSADLLLNAIRDDRDQHTSYRTMRCLESLGLDPLPTTRQLQKLLHLCGGSDIALLWFLWEWLYQDSHSDSYSVNEQLILTSIAHLDMNTTMRELDRILPPAQSSKKVLERKRRLEKERKNKKINSSQCKKQQYNSPYFEKIPEPIQRRTSYIGIERDRQAILGRYQYQFKDPSFVIANENSRWFKDYKLDPNKRAACGIINEEISKMFDNFNAAMLDNDKVEALCRHHEEIEQLKNSFDAQLNEFAKKKTKAMGEAFLKRHRNYNHVIQRLHHDIEKYRQEFHEMAENCRKHWILKILSNGLQSNNNNSKTNISKILKSHNDENAEFTTIISCGAIDDDGKPHKPTLGCGCVVAKILQHDKEPIETSLPKIKTLLECNRDKIGEHNFQCGCIIGQEDYCTTQCSCYHNSIKEVEMDKKTNGIGQKTSLMDFQEIYLSENGCISSTTSVSNPDTQYVEASAEHQTFKFDYRKIFQFKNNDNEIMKIKTAFVEAVDSDIALLNRLQKDSYIALQDNKALDNAIKKCTNKIWQQEIEKHDALKFENDRKLELQNTIVDYNMDYYDPDDDKLMDRLLKDALDIMKKDKKFVFASLPAAHRFSMLREWIRLRYGKMYSRNELTKSFQESLPIFTALAKVGLSVKLPSNSDMGTDLVTDYSCRDYVVRKSEYIRKEFYKRIDKAILAQSRVIYFAMRPFLCSNGPPRNTIFAYMPAHKRENYYFRPWKPQECMRHKQVNYFQPWKLKETLRSTGKRKVNTTKNLRKHK